MYCNCKDFKSYTEWLMNCENFAWHHGWTIPNDVKIMKYCAWCGKKLKDEKNRYFLPVSIV